MTASREGRAVACADLVFLGNDSSFRRANGCMAAWIRVGQRPLPVKNARTCFQIKDMGPLLPEDNGSELGPWIRNVRRRDRKRGRDRGSSGPRALRSLRVQGADASP